MSIPGRDHGGQECRRAAGEDDEQVAALHAGRGQHGAGGRLQRFLWGKEIRYVESLQVMYKILTGHFNGRVGLWRAVAVEEGQSRFVAATSMGG